MEPIGWSPDGCQIAYKGQDSKLYAMSLFSNATVVLVPDKHWSHPVWSRSGEWVAYDTDSMWNNSPTQIEVFLVGADGAQRRQLTDNESRDLVIGWMPGETEALIWSERDTGAGLYAVDVATLDQRLVADLAFLNNVAPRPDLSVVPEPSILSPDGKRVRLALLDTAGWGNVYWVGVLDLETGEHWVLHEGVYAEFGYDWSPDSKMVAFGARNLDQDSLDTARVYLQDVSSGSVALLDSLGVTEGDAYPSWSPDGAMLSVQRWLQPMILDRQTGTKIELDSEWYESRALLWSPRSAYGPGDCQ